MTNQMTAVGEGRAAARMAGGALAYYDYGSPLLASVCHLYGFSIIARALPNAEMGRTMLFIWCVMFSSQLCTDSVRAIIATTLQRMTACDARGFPNALR